MKAIFKTTIEITDDNRDAVIKDIISNQFTSGPDCIHVERQIFEFDKTTGEANHHDVFTTTRTRKEDIAFITILAYKVKDNENGFAPVSFELTLKAGNSTIYLGYLNHFSVGNLVDWNNDVIINKVKLTGEEKANMMILIGSKKVE